jgi:hypothetical protein
MRLAESGPLPRLLERGTKLEERESFNARTEWPSLRRDALQRRILEAATTIKDRPLSREAVAVLFQADAGISLLRRRFL